MKVFFSKKDLWLSLIVWTPFPIFLILAIYQTEFIAAFVLIITMLLIGWMWFGTKYSITATHIKVQCGPFKYSDIAISEIKNISHSSSVLSAPACSLDRLHISYGKYDEILISPKEAELFIKTLLQKNTSILYTPK